MHCLRARFLSSFPDDNSIGLHRDKHIKSNIPRFIPNHALAKHYHAHETQTSNAQPNIRTNCIDR